MESVVKRLWLVISVEGISVKGWVIIRLWSSSPHSNTCYLVFKKEQANARGRRPQRCGCWLYFMTSLLDLLLEPFWP